MGLVEGLALAATITSGVLSAIVLCSAILDAITGGYVRGKTRSWLGIDDIRQKSTVTQVFIRDLGQAHNEMVETVGERLDVPDHERPAAVDVERYHRYINNGDIEEGYFLEEEE